MPRFAVENFSFIVSEIRDTRDADVIQSIKMPNLRTFTFRVSYNSSTVSGVTRKTEFLFVPKFQRIYIQSAIR